MAAYFPGFPIKGDESDAMRIFGIHFNICKANTYICKYVHLSLYGLCHSEYLSEHSCSQILVRQLFWKICFQFVQIIFMRGINAGT